MNTNGTNADRFQPAPDEFDDVQGHLRAKVDGPDGDDTEGHLRAPKFSEEDDAEGHRVAKLADEDVEAHLRAPKFSEEDDAEGHRRLSVDGPDTDDTEGHRVYQ